MEHTGIVLKTFFSKKRKMIVLDEYHGKIEVAPSHDHYILGSLLSYTNLVRSSTIYFLSQATIIDMPLRLAKDDILFLHHVLEICYFCAPFEKNNSEIFALILQLYKSHINNDQFKIAFLFKLLILLGMHPHEPLFHDSYYYLLSQESIDTIMSKSIHLDTKQALYQWVYSCMAGHPLMHVFKTMHFLDNDRFTI